MARLTKLESLFPRIDTFLMDSFTFATDICIANSQAGDFLTNLKRISFFRYVSFDLDFYTLVRLLEDIILSMFS